MKNIKYLFFIIITLSFFILASCDELALGERLYLDPPTVTITSPGFMDNISGTSLTITGTAHDVHEIIYLYVSVEKVVKGASTPWSREWICERGIWTGDPLINSSWTKKSATTTEWEIEFAINTGTMGQGEFLITAWAENSVHNKGPVDQTRLIIDNEAPAIKIHFPVLEGASNSYGLRDYTVIDKLHTNEIKIQYEITDNYLIKDFILELRNGAASVYNKTFEDADSFGTVIVTAQELSSLGSGKTILQIYTRAVDRAGNSSGNVSQGYVTWWPDARFPWAEGFTSASDTGQSNVQQVFMGSPVALTAYGKFGIRQARYRIDPYIVNSYVTGSFSSYMQNPVYGDAERSNFFNFNFTAPSEIGRYRIIVETEDIHGNKSQDNVNTFYINVFDSGDLAPLAMRYSGSPPGLYGRGQTVDIDIDFREAIRFTGTAPALELNITNRAATAVYISGNDSNVFKFRYTIGNNDVTGGEFLEVTGIDFSGGLSKADGSALPDIGSMSNSELLRPKNQSNVNYDFSFFRKIRIDTSLPEINDHNLTGNILTLTFNKQIFKGTGNVTLAQQGTFLAPAVLTKAEYDRFNTNNGLAGYYTAGINGADSSGEPDTTEKYILKYGINTNGTGSHVNIDGTTTTGTGLITSLANAGMNEVKIPVVAQNVTIQTSSSALPGVTNNELRIVLSGAYEPFVKGVNYLVTYDTGIVRDSQNNNVAALAAAANRTISVTGVNKPFVRVERRSETYGGNPVVATQTRTAAVKFDCQTPTAAILYSFSERETAPLPANHNYNGTSHKPANPAAPGAPDKNPSTDPLTLPDTAAKQNSNNGYLFLIRVQAGAGAAAETNYELAARSVIQFDRNGISNWNTIDNLNARRLNIWIRGGDQTSGENNTAGFPLKWDDGTTGPYNNGARLFTQDGATNWIWMTWEVNVPAYFNFLAGTTDNRVNDIRTYGPIEWIWGRNLWAFQHHQFPLFPGSSLTFHRTTSTASNATDEFTFGNQSNMQWNGVRTTRLDN